MRSRLDMRNDGRSSTTERRARRPRTGLRVASAVFVVLAIFATITARLFIWPPLPPVPTHVDAIIELAGPGGRDATTIALARQHIAPLVIQSTVPGDATSDTCLPPMPEITIKCFSPVPPTTRGEARYIGDQAVALGWKSIVIVTTPDHAWRARLRVQRCFPGEVYVKTSPLPPRDWLRQIPYQWAATVKAELFQRDC